MNIFTRLHNFFLCFLQTECQYDSKKLLAFIFSGLAIYLAIFTTKADFFFETITFVAVLLGIRAWQMNKINENKDKPNENVG